MSIEHDLATALALLTRTQTECIALQKALDAANARRSLPPGCVAVPMDGGTATVKMGQGAHAVEATMNFHVSSYTWKTDPMIPVSRCADAVEVASINRDLEQRNHELANELNQAYADITTLREAAAKNTPPDVAPYTTARAHVSAQNEEITVLRHQVSIAQQAHATEKNKHAALEEIVRKLRTTLGHKNAELAGLREALIGVRAALAPHKGY